MNTDDALSMTVTYTLVDVFWALVHNSRRLLRLVLILELLWIVLSVGADMVDGATLIEASSWIPWKLLALGGVIIGALWLVLCPLIGYARLRRAGVLGPNTFTLVDRGVGVQTPKSEAVVYWSAIRRLVRTSSRYYIFLSTGGAIIIPRRAFRSEEEFEAFVSTTRNRWEHGQGS